MFLGVFGHSESNGAIGVVLNGTSSKL